MTDDELRRRGRTAGAVSDARRGARGVRAAASRRHARPTALLCAALALSGCANILHDTSAKTELEIAQCYAAAERGYMRAHDTYCGAEVTPAECAYTDALRAHRSAAQDRCEQ